MKCVQLRVCPIALQPPSCPPLLCCCCCWGYLTSLHALQDDGTVLLRAHAVSAPNQGGNGVPSAGPDPRHGEEKQRVRQVQLDTRDGHDAVGRRPAVTAVCLEPEEQSAPADGPVSQLRRIAQCARCGNRCSGCWLSRQNCYQNRVLVTARFATRGRRTRVRSTSQTSSLLRISTWVLRGGRASVGRGLALCESNQPAAARSLATGCSGGAMAVQAVLNAFLACMFTYTLTAAGGTSERRRWWRMWAVSGGGRRLTAVCTLAGCQSAAQRSECTCLIRTATRARQLL